MNRYKRSVLFLFLVGCSSSPVPPKKISLQSSYVASKVNQYFLASLPQWVNFSAVGKCRRTSDIRYLNLEKLSQSYGLDYSQAIQLQAMFNVEWNLRGQKTGRRILSPREEEMIFYEVLDKIKGGLGQFRTPRFRRVNLVWVDRLLQDEAGKRKLQKLFSSVVMDKGVPVLISVCHTTAELQSMLKKMSLKAPINHLITAEFFSPYNTEKQLMMSFQLFFYHLFNDDQKLHFYSPSEYVPEEFQGSFRPHRL